MTDDGGPALERLWAGWRSAFVTASPVTTPPVTTAPVTTDPVTTASVNPAAGAASGSGPDCVFCALLASGAPDEQTHILWRHGSGVAIAILNLYPYTSGHLMVMPTRHVGEVEGLADDESRAVWEGMTAGARALKAAYQPDALNLGANIGRAAGAGVPGHFHVHVVPRWNGDTNFMTTVADARVLPEALAETDRRLRAAWPTAPPAS